METPFQSLEDLSRGGGTIDPRLLGLTEVESIGVQAKKAVKDDALVESPAVVALNASATSTQDRTGPTPQCHVDGGQKKAHKFTIGKTAGKG
jgi:hypothetical protein